MKEWRAFLDEALEAREGGGRAGGRQSWELGAGSWSPASVLAPLWYSRPGLILSWQLE